MIYAIRGAITVDSDKAEDVDIAVKELMSELYAANSLFDDDIVSVIFSQTKDIRSRNAAAACRKGGFCKEVPLFCVQEADTEGALPLAVRVMITVDKEEKNPAMLDLWHEKIPFDCINSFVCCIRSFRYSCRECQC